MKKIISMTALAALLLCVCFGAEAAGHNVLVAYFSATGNTELVADEVAEALDADVYEILPAEPYTEADLDWNDASSRTTLEQNDDTCRPALAEKIPDLSEYDTVLIGHPIWWGQAPKLIYTFVESAKLSGKTVSTFCTSASSSLGTSAENLRKCTGPDVTWLKSCRFPANAGRREVQSWLKDIGLLP